MKKMINKLVLFTLVAGIALVPMASVAPFERTKCLMKLSPSKIRQCLAENQKRLIAERENYCKKKDKEKGSVWYGAIPKCYLLLVAPHIAAHSLLQSSEDIEKADRASGVLR